MAITVGRQAQSSTHSGQLRERGPTESRASETEVAEAKAMTVLSAGSSSVSGQVAPASGPRGRLALCRRAARLAAQPVPAAGRKVSARARWTGSKSR